MKFLPRAAAIAAVTFCVGAMANAATLNVSDVLQDGPAQEINVQEHHVVPLPQPAAAPLPEAKPAEIVQPLPEAESDPIQFASLSEAVAAQQADTVDDDELRCLAVGVYYEAKSEPLAGQLAVAEVILNRTTSGRFPRSVCSVLTQRGQFSFIRAGKVPTPPANAQWRKAMAVAQVAQKNLWESPVEDALYFHARYVSPRWKRARVGTVGNHVFYR
jgi:spore germination cell wall hydrolase CwlJ-like protein